MLTMSVIVRAQYEFMFPFNASILEASLHVPRMSIFEEYSVGTEMVLCAYKSCRVRTLSLPYIGGKPNCNTFYLDY